eukprot:TRINITY_DN2112_c0_g3_i1.p1 TRINITY_DN2112_c0_g3~~TRINITY_DN2112_c0_g3_i1.p1  ORF type:complete len:344 (+),score=82.24 TRINITY_DN2112_c0_g3_i1:27-1034(+)
MAAAAASGDSKSELNQFLQKYLKRPVQKTDIVYIVSKFGPTQFQAIVRIPGLGGAEYAGQVCHDQKAAEKAAAEQALAANAVLIEETNNPSGERQSKRAKLEEEGFENPAITPKTHLNSLVMKIAKRFLQKGETVYQTNKVDGQYQSTVTLSALPGEWAERSWAGHLQSTKQKAEQSAAEEALNDIKADPELSAEAAKPKGGGKGKGGDGGKGKGKGKFGGMKGGMNMAMMMSAWGPWGPMGPMAKGGKGGGSWNRERITDVPAVGSVTEWKGNFGWATAAIPISHPAAQLKGGKIYIHQRDLPAGVESLFEGQSISFHVYADANGCGAEEVALL